MTTAETARRRIAVGFPGQGAHDPVKFARLIREHPVTLDLVVEAEDTLRMPLLPLLLTEASSESNNEEIKVTRDNQVKLYVGEAALWLAAEAEGIIPEDHDRIFFGASAGEYAALMAAGAYDFADGLGLINVRGEEMHNASIINPGTMLSASGLPFEEAEVLSQMFPGVYAVNDNPGLQTVLAGSVDGLVAFANHISSSDRWKEAVKLDWQAINEAAHTIHMAPAIPGLKKALRRTRMSRPKDQFMGNQAEMVDKVRDIKAHLSAQLVRGVLLTRSANELRDNYGVNTFIDVGLRRILSSQMKRHFRKSVEVIAVVDKLLPQKD